MKSLPATIRIVTCRWEKRNEIGVFAEIVQENLELLRRSVGGLMDSWLMQAITSEKSRRNRVAVFEEAAAPFRAKLMGSIQHRIAEYMAEFDGEQVVVDSSTSAIRVENLGYTPPAQVEISISFEEQKIHWHFSNVSVTEGERSLTVSNENGSPIVVVRPRERTRSTWDEFELLLRDVLRPVLFPLLK